MVRLVVVVGLLVFAITPLSGNDKGLPQKGPGDPKLSYGVVYKDPQGFRGKRVTWVGWVPSTNGKEVLVVHNERVEKDDRNFKRYIVRFSSEDEAAKLFSSGPGKFTGTVAGRIRITYLVSDGQGDFVERQEDVPLIVHAQFEEDKAQK